jgi:TonB family protein
VTRRLSLWLLLSLGIHAVLVGLTLVLIGLSPRPLPMLFVDLVQGFLSPAGPAPGGAVTGGDGLRAGASRGAAPGRPAPEPRRATRSEPGPAAATPQSTTPVPERTVPPERTPPAEIQPPALPPRGLALQEPSRMRSQPMSDESARPAPEPAPPAAPAAPAQVVEGVPPAASGSGVPDTPARGTGPGDVAGAPPAGGSASTNGRGSGGSSAGGGRGSAGDGQGLGRGLGAREGSVLALAIPGEGSGVGSEYQGYARLLRQRVQQALAYPPAAHRRQLTGSVELKVTVDASGAVTEVALAGSSSHRMLDEAALQAAREVRRVPFPPDVAPRPLRVPVTVRFDLR